MRWAAALQRRFAALRLTERIRRRTNFQRGLLYIGARRALMGGKWTPLDYFRRGEQGAWYDPSDLSTLFQNAAGTTPVTGIEQPVGLMLDKRLGLVLGPERVTGDNSTFTTGTGDWASRINASISAVGGELVCTATAINGTAGLFLTGLTVGVYYVISCTARTGTSSAAQIRLGTGTAIYTPSNTSTALTGVFSAVDATCDLQVIAGTAGTFYIDNISVRELPGNHAFQTTTTSRPVLSARVNKFVSTEALATQSITTLATTHTLRFEGSGSIVLTGSATGTYTAGTYNINCTAGTLIATITGSVLKADLREIVANSIMPAYQRVSTATDYDTAGFPLYLRTNGFEAFMVTNAIDFTGTDKMTVVTGLRKIGTAASVPIELSTATNTNAGAFGVYTQDGTNSYSFTSRGTGPVATSKSPAAYAPPITNVITGVANISAPLNQLRVNGSVTTTVTTSQGTGNFGNYPLYLFRRGGTSFPANVYFYGLIVRGAETQEALLNPGQKYIAGKTGVVL